MDKEMFAYFVEWRSKCITEAKDFIDEARSYRQEGRMDDAAWAFALAQNRFMRARNYTALIRGY